MYAPRTQEKRRASSFRHRAALIFCGSLSVLVAGCATDKVTGKKKFALVQWSVEEEQQMGDTYAPNFQAEYDGPLLDAQANAYLDGLIREMATHSVRKDDFAYRFTILNSSTPNAFALPGGYVYVTRGLLQNLETEGQFISVMGHELGHVEHQHSMFQQNRLLLTAVSLGIGGIIESQVINKGDPDKPTYVTAAAAVAVPVFLLRYDRNQELESDARGVYFSHRMGYNPNEGARTFEYFQRLERESGSSTPELLRTHPLNERRVDEIRRRVAEEYPEIKTKPKESFRPLSDNNRRFEQIVSRLKSVAPAYQKYDDAMMQLARSSEDPQAFEKAGKLLDEARRMLPDEPLFIIGAGELMYAQQKGDRGRADFEKALKTYELAGPRRGHWKPSFYLGALAVDSGNGAQAESLLKKSAGVFPMQPLIHYYLGRAQELGGRLNEALSSYQNVLQLAPEESALHKNASKRLAELQPDA